MASLASISSQTLETVRVTKEAIGSLGGDWMESEAEEAAAEAAGLDDWQYYFVGRHAVVGGAELDADVISAAAYMFPPDYLRRQWESACAVTTPAKVVASYVELCHAWGRENLGDFDGARRLADLTEKVVSAVDVPGLPLFAGWRAVTRPDDVGARCGHLLHLLREHRGGCHGIALVATGVSPLVAILVEGGEENAEEFGWDRPYPAVTASDREMRDQAEELTDRLVATPYATLSEVEQAELVTLIARASEHCVGK